MNLCFAYSCKITKNLAPLKRCVFAFIYARRRHLLRDFADFFRAKTWQKTAFKSKHNARFELSFAREPLVCHFGKFVAVFIQICRYFLQIHHFLVSAPSRQIITRDIYKFLATAQIFSTKFPAITTKFPCQIST